MDVQEIINYIEKTPNNSNPNVLRGMLENMTTLQNTFDVNVTYQGYKEMTRTFAYDIGMTWGEFISSNYNPIIDTYGDLLFAQNSSGIVHWHDDDWGPYEFEFAVWDDDEQKTVKSTDLIDSRESYSVWFLKE